MNQEQKIIEAALEEFQIKDVRAETVCQAMKCIFLVCCTRDDKNLSKMAKSDLGLSLLKLAQFYGESGETNRRDFILAAARWRN